MAQSRLAAVASCITVLAAGVLAEYTSHGSAELLTVVDYAVGAGFAVGGAWLVVSDRRTGWLSLAAAAAWFAGTAAVAAIGLPAYVGDVAVLAYRGFLINLLVCTISAHRPIRRARVLIVVGYLACLVPYSSAGLVTAAVMGVIAVQAAQSARHAPSDSRQILAAIALSTAALATVWLLGAVGVSGGTVLQSVNDLLVLDVIAVIVAESARGDWLHGAINALVLDLGPSRRRSAPVRQLLAEALADPGLEVCYRVPDLGWFDEAGATVEPPPEDSQTSASRMTIVAVPNVGDVAIIHSTAAPPATALTQAAATAAALALDSARVRADARQQASAVRESGQRLLAVADAERQHLEVQLRVGPVGRLQRLHQALAQINGTIATEIRDQLATALEDLADLAGGLFPGALAARSMDEVLAEVIASMPIPVRLETEGLERLPAEQRALTYFFCSECLANISRHADATAASVTVRVKESHLMMNVDDDGKGGATLFNARGLRGLADRVEVFGGQLTVVSPIGGPTSILARIPIS